MSTPYADLFMDTARTPAALGQRAAGPTDRQLVYRHEGLQLELMLQAGDAAATFVWGQLCATVSGRPCRGARIALLDEDSRRVAETETDVFGEFSVAAPRLVEGTLAVEMPRGRFLCWLAPSERELPAPVPGARTA